MQRLVTLPVDPVDQPTEGKSWMRMTLQELNDRIWYRALKIVYIVSYMGLFAIGSLLVIDVGRYHIPSHLPSSALKAFQDENFYLLSSAEMISALTSIDADFGNLPESEKQKAINDIKQNKSKHSKGKANYVYVTQTDISISKAVSFGAVYILITIFVMEFIRRCFYYVVVGQILPTKRQ